MELVDSQGRPLRLGREIGRGGEGKVYELLDHPNRVAKVYEAPPSAEKVEKLVAMARSPSASLLTLAAWPLDTIWKSGGAASGLVMPRIVDHKPAHFLYSPKSRQIEFPQASWPFLVHTARNIAAAFQTVHDHGHVVGDVNHGNLLVSSQATVTLIDCDSFQISANGRLYPCEVGISTHTPPELQGMSFRGVTRTSNHDSFGLAVLLFQILFMGRHPFSGRFIGGKDLTLEEAIRECRFAYGPRAGERGMQPPPNTLPLEAVSEPLVLLFERAFSAQSAHQGRPPARDWIEPLSRLSERLQPCSANPSHAYLQDLSDCPWCELEGRSGVRFFGVVIGRARPAQPVDVAALWAAIEAVPRPAPAPQLPVLRMWTPQTTPEIRQRAVKRTQRWIGAVGASSSATLLLVAWLASSGADWLVATVFRSSGADWLVTAVFLVLPMLLGYRIGSTPPPALVRELEQGIRSAEAALDAARYRWKQLASEQRFDQALLELDRVKTALGDLPGLRARRLEELVRTRRERELLRFLDGYRIADGRITGIGPGLAAQLLSAGIETAADVNYNRICGQVSGFGPVRAQALVDWRTELERRFRFDPNRELSPADFAALDTEMAAEQARLAAALRAGPDQLRQITAEIQSARDALHPEIELAQQRLVQARHELRLL